MPRSVPVAQIALVVALAGGCGGGASTVAWDVRSGPDVLRVTVVDHLHVVEAVAGVARPIRLPGGRSVAIDNARPSLETLRLSWWSGSCQTRPTITLLSTGVETVVVLDPGPYRCGAGVAEARSIELALVRPLAAGFLRVERILVPDDA
jgi:hypothetical protein